MDSFVPTEKVLEEIRESKVPVCYLVGTPRGLLSRYESELSGKHWDEARESVRVKILMKIIQMIDVHVPTTDGRELRMSRYTKPDKAQQLLLSRLKLNLPPQPPPEISTGMKSSVVKTFKICY
jgi:hypothetical protein